MSEKFDDLPKEQKRAILAIIDHKTEQDMKEVLSRLDAIKDSMQSEITSIKDSMQSLEGKIMSSVKGEISGIKYMIGGLALLLTILSIVLTIAFKFL